MGARPLRMKVWWGCPPRVLSLPPQRTQSWWPCLPGQPWASGWRSTDAFALRATKVTARSLGKAMSTIHHGGPGAPSLAQPGRDEGRRQGTLSRRPHLPGRAVRRHRRGLCPKVLGGTAADRGDPAHLPRRDAPSTAAPGARPQSACRRGRPPVSSKAALAGERRPPRPSQAPSRPGSRRSGPDVGNPEMLEFALSQEKARTVPLLPLVEGREENLPFLFRRRSKVPTFSRKSNFLFLRVLRSMGRQCVTPCFLTLAHDPFCQ